MQYAAFLRKLFAGIELDVEDLLLLESFQISYLPDRTPRQELAVLLRANPVVRRYLVSMCPSVKPFIAELMGSSEKNDKPVEANCNDLLWEIADLMAYSKYPEVYNANVDFPSHIDEIIPPRNLKKKVVIDAGAGPGKLAFLAAQFAKTVFAVEPGFGFRRFIREKASRESSKNLFVVDDFSSDWVEAGG